ncbi:hypothetical protein [Wolbachia endosymbiont of Protocalliphora sialia]
MYVQKHNFQELSNILLNKFTDIDMDKFAIAIGNVQKSESESSKQNYRFGRL